MRKLAQEQFRLTAIDEHQFRECEVRRKGESPALAASCRFHKKTVADDEHCLEHLTPLRLAQQRAVLVGQIQTINRAQ